MFDRFDKPSSTWHNNSDKWHGINVGESNHIFIHVICLNLSTWVGRS